MAEAPESGTYSESIRTAAKDHKCYECRKKIQKGTRHWFIKGLWEGAWMEFRFCVRCVRIRDMAYAKYGDYSDEVGFGELREFIWEMGAKDVLGRCRARWHKAGMQHMGYMTWDGTKDECATFRARKVTA